MLDRFKFWVHKPKKYNVGKTTIRLTFLDNSVMNTTLEGVTMIGIGNRDVFNSEALAKCFIEDAGRDGFFKINGKYLNTNQVKMAEILETIPFEVEQ